MVVDLLRSIIRKISDTAIFSWASKGLWAVVDQALYSGANFFVNILLARWLFPDEYGAFAVAMSVFYLLAGFHTALLAEPMMVFGAGKYRESFRKYLGVLLFSHFGLSGLFSFLLGSAALATARSSSEALAQALAGLAVASPFLLLFWFMRRGCYVLLRPMWAALGSGVNFSIVLVGMFLFIRLGIISLLAGIGIMGAAAAVSGLLLVYALRPQIRGWNSDPTPGAILLRQWAYARWSLATVLLMWIPGNVYFSILPLTSGLQGSAALRALNNIVLPVHYVIQALTLLVIPILASAARHERVKFKNQVKLIMAIMLSLVLLYYAVLILLGPTAMRLLYGDKYADTIRYLLLAGLIPVFGSITSVIGGALRAVERPDRIFIGYILSTIIAVGVGVPLTLRLGLMGAVIGQLLGALTTAAVLLGFYITWVEGVKKQ